MKRILKNGEKIRKYVNEKNLYDKYFKGKSDKWNKFCVANDVLDDTCLSLLYFESHSFGRADGGKYLKLYGFFQSIYLQQESISTIYHIFTNKKLNPGKSTSWIEIRNMRTLTAGHPIEKTSGGKGLQRCYISRVTISKKGFQLIIWNKDTGKNEFKEIDLESLYDSYKIEAIKYLYEIYQFLKKEG